MFKMLEIISNLGIAENRETREIAMAINRSEVTPCHLYLVTLTRKREMKYPAVSLYYVIAPNEEEAISQCQSLAFPEMEGCVLWGEMEAALSATASRVPVMIRGWGHQTF